MLNEQNQQMQNKISEDARVISEVRKENEDMRQDLVRFHQTIELGMKENEQFKLEINRLREELQESQVQNHGISNQNASILADKDKEIAELRAELLRTKAIISTQDARTVPESPSQKQSSSMLDLLLSNNPSK